MARVITKKQVKQYRRDFSSDVTARVAQNAVTGGDLLEIALNRDLVQDIDSSYSI